MLERLRRGDAQQPYWSEEVDTLGCRVADLFRMNNEQEKVEEPEDEDDALEIEASRNVGEVGLGSMVMSLLMESLESGWLMLQGKGKCCLGLELELEVANVDMLSGECG